MFLVRVGDPKLKHLTGAKKIKAIKSINSLLSTKTTNMAQDDPGISIVCCLTVGVSLYDFDYFVIMGNTLHIIRTITLAV